MIWTIKFLKTTWYIVAKKRVIKLIILVLTHEDNYRKQIKHTNMKRNFSLTQHFSTFILKKLTFYTITTLSVSYERLSRRISDWQHFSIHGPIYHFNFLYLFLKKIKKNYHQRRNDKTTWAECKGSDILNIIIYKFSRSRLNCN